MKTAISQVCSGGYSSCFFGGMASLEPRHRIAKTDKGWQLVIQNEHFSVMQVFRSEETARDAVDRMMEFFDSVSPQAPAKITSDSARLVLRT